MSGRAEDRPWRWLLALLLAAMLFPRATLALDKQVRGQRCDQTIATCGSLFWGPFLHNRGYSASPDNAGKTLYRLGLHIDQNLAGRLAVFTLDVNSYADRYDEAQVALSEVDVIAGLISEVTPWLELGIHFEHDAPIGVGKRTLLFDDQGRGTPAVRSGISASYMDVAARATWATDLGERRLALTAGFAVLPYNPTYAARPDITGLALFRYLLHQDFDLVPRLLTLRLDENFFTDRCADGSGVMAPSELDFVAELVFRPEMAKGVGVALAYERDMIVTEGTLTSGCGGPRAGPSVAEYLALMVSWQFAVGWKP